MPTDPLKPAIPPRWGIWIILALVLMTAIAIFAGGCAGPTQASEPAPPPVEMGWERVNAGNGPGFVYRTWVPGGWLVFVRFYSASTDAAAATFFPDPTHAWLTPREHKRPATTPSASPAAEEEPK